MTKGFFFLPLLCLWLFTTANSAQALDMTGRASIVSLAAMPASGDAGYKTGQHNLLANQASLRLMFDDTAAQSQWSIHATSTYQRSDGLPLSNLHSSDLFRYRPLAGNWHDTSSASDTNRLGYDIDRLVYKRNFDNISLALGRQAMDWGSGRFWQPLNVFGAFAPTDLDTDYKTGIDAAVLDWYPSAFSSLTTVYIPKSDEHGDSMAIYARNQVGEAAEVSVLAGQVLGNKVLGASIESEALGMGWRWEGLRYETQAQTTALFWIGGLDYQFENGTLLATEWYHNSAGADNEVLLAASQSNPRVIYGLQQHLGKNVLGLALNNDITALLHGSYALFTSFLQDTAGRNAFSFLHQASLSYLMSDESDLLFSALIGQGKGLDTSLAPQSEFGHLPSSVTLRYRRYF